MSAPQGQSGDATEIKQRGLSLAFRIGLVVVNKIARQVPHARYFHFDLNAGGGYNHEAGCIGSPLTFHNEARLANCTRYFAGFCDRDKHQVESLLRLPTIRDDPQSFVLHGDNDQLLAMVPDIVSHYGERRQHAIGSILSDPNGADVPIDAIIELAHICPKLDVIFHWNSTITKRLRYGVSPQQLVLQDVVRLVRKEHWLIREPVGIHQFTLLIGRNWRFGDWSKNGFFDLDTPRGQAVLDRCSLSRRDIDRRDQPDLSLW